MASNQEVLADIMTKLLALDDLYEQSRSIESWLSSDTTVQETYDTLKCISRVPSVEGIHRLQVCPCVTACRLVKAWFKKSMNQASFQQLRHHGQDSYSSARKMSRREEKG